MRQYRSSTGLGANVSVCVRGYVYELRNGNVMGTLGEEKETETDGERGREGGEGNLDDSEAVGRSAGAGVRVLTGRYITEARVSHSLGKKGACTLPRYR